MTSFLLAAVLTDYLWPAKTIPQVICVVLWAGAIIWWIRYRGVLAQLGNAHQTLKRINGSIGLLTGASREFSAGSAWGEQTPEASFHYFVSEVGLEMSHSVTQQLESVFLAGCYQSKLDQAELTRRTIGVVACGASSLKTSVNVFVVVGLLGTLFGISDSVIAFQGLSSSQGQEIPDRLFASLQGAFAPSIWGVAVSVVFGLIAAFRLAPSVTGFAEDLRHTMSRYWVPCLMPTSTQRMAAAADRTLEAAGRVVEFAVSIEDRAKGLKDELETAADVAKTLNTAMKRMKTAVTDSSEAVAGTLGDLECKVAAFAKYLGELSEFQKRSEEQQAETTRYLNALSQSAEQAHENSQALPGLMGQLKVAVDGFQKPFEDAAGRIEGAASLLGTTHEKGLSDLSNRLEERLKYSIEAQRELIQQATDAVNTAASASKTVTGEVLTGLSQLRSPFENSATKLESQSATVMNQIATQLLWLNEQWSKQKDFLEAFLRDWHGPEQEQPAPPSIGVGDLNAMEKALGGRLTAIERLLDRMSPAKYGARPQRSALEPVGYDTISTVNTTSRADGAF